MSWLEQHTEEFVIPTCEERGWDYKLAFPTHNPVQPYFQPEELTVIKNTWRSIKRQAKGQTVLLPGRDVWVFEVLARRENYPTVFIPECSRMTVKHIAKERPELAELFVFDTGFVGSIPRGLGSKQFSLLSHQRPFVPYGTEVEDTVQTFPRLSFSRGLALRIENTPKYWESGRLVGPMNYSTGNVTLTDGTVMSSIEFSSTYGNAAYRLADDHVVQPIAHEREFMQAVRLTHEVYKNSAPKFINKHKPMGKGGTFWQVTTKITPAW